MVTAEACVVLWLWAALCGFVAGVLATCGYINKKAGERKGEHDNDTDM